MGGCEWLTKLTRRSLEKTNPAGEKHIELPAEEGEQSEIIPLSSGAGDIKTNLLQPELDPVPGGCAQTVQAALGLQLQAWR